MTILMFHNFMLTRVYILTSVALFFEDLVLDYCESTIEFQNIICTYSLYIMAIR